MLLMSVGAYTNFLKVACSCSRLNIDTVDLCTEKDSFRVSPKSIDACDFIAHTFEDEDIELLNFCFESYKGVTDYSVFADAKGISVAEVKKKLLRLLECFVSSKNVPLLSYGVREGQAKLVELDNICYSKHKRIIECIKLNCKHSRGDDVELYIMLSVPIIYLDLGGSCVKKLKEHGINTLFDLRLNYLQGNLANLKGIGGSSMKNIFTLLCVLGLLTAQDRIDYLGVGSLPLSKGVLAECGMRLI